MPLIVPKRIHRSHAVLPITFATTTSLVVALCYLQLIYLASWILRPIWSFHRDFPPLKRTMQRVEKLVLDLILGIIPVATYRSPAPTSILHEDSLGHRIGSVVHAYASRATLDNVSYNQTGFTTPPNLPQCCPGTASGRTTVNPQDYRLELAKQSPFDQNGSQSSSNYDTIKKSSNNRSKVSSVGVGPAAPRQPSQSSVSLRPFREPEDNAKASEHPPNSPHASQKSPVCSVDGPCDLAAPLESPPAVEPSNQEKPSNQDEDGLKLDRETKCRSTESYPGQFPVSESTEFTSLATASYAFRERGTTSVRPFSDY